MTKERRLLLAANIRLGELVYWQSLPDEGGCAFYTKSLWIAWRRWGQWDLYEPFNETREPPTYFGAYIEKYDLDFQNIMEYLES